MFFRNLTLFRFPTSLDLTELETRLEHTRLKPVGPLELSSRGFVSPFGRDGEALQGASPGRAPRRRCALRLVGPGV